MMLLLLIFMMDTVAVELVCEVGADASLSVAAEVPTSLPADAGRPRILGFST